MKRVAALFFCLYSTFSFAQTPTTSSVKTLLKLTKADSIIDTQFDQLPSLVNGILSNEQKAKMTLQEQVVLQDMMLEISAMYKRELAWNKIEPLIVSLYQQNYTQNEVDGMIDFYQSPVGQSVTNKMPALTKNTMKVMADFTQKNVMPKFAQIVQNNLQKIQKNGSQR